MTSASEQNHHNESWHRFINPVTYGDHPVVTVKFCLSDALTHAPKTKTVELCRKKAGQILFIRTRKDGRVEFKVGEKGEPFAVFAGVTQEVLQNLADNLHQAGRTDDRGRKHIEKPAHVDLTFDSIRSARGSLEVLLSQMSDAGKNIHRRAYQRVEKIHQRFVRQEKVIYSQPRPVG